MRLAELLTSERATALRDGCPVVAEGRCSERTRALRCARNERSLGG